MRLWYRKLGFHNNPFSIKPAAFHAEMVAYDLDYIYEKIDNAELLFIEGLYGSGKTTILKSIINNFRGKNKIIYFSFNNGRNFDTKKLIDGANSFFRRISGLKVRDIIMLLDEVNNMTKSHAKDILNFYQTGIIQSIVFVDKDYNKISLPDDVQTYLNGNVIRTVDLSQDEAVDLVKSRLGDIGLFPNKILKKIFDLADKNPRRYLAYCEDVARYAVEMDDYEVSEFHLDTVLEDVVGSKKKPVKKKVKAKPKPKKAVKKEPVKTKKPVELKADKKKEDEKPRQKKFKVNRLIEGKKEPLGAIEATEEPKVEVEKTEKKEEKPKSETKEGDEPIPEYKVFVFDD